MTTTTESQPATLTIDKTHSEVVFQVRHLLTKVRGRFRDFEGTIHFDEQAPERSRVEFSIKAASIDTDTPDRDTHLRSDDFFAADKYPSITFRSTQVAKTGPNTFDVAGALTLRGVTRDITLPVVYSGTAKDPWGSYRAGFETEATLNRKDFGLNWNAALETGGFLVGDEIKITINIEAVVKQG